MKRRAGVLGQPIGHSLSPALHNAGYAAAGLADWTYTAHECAEADLTEFVAGLGPEWVGLSLTMPLKEVALAVADEVAPPAAAIGAANTLVRQPDGRWRAENTDAPGMVDALAGVGLTTAGRVAVLGAGGTARAALAAARDLGARSVTVYARRPEAIEPLRAVAANLALPMDGGRWADVAGAGQADLVVATVPAGVADPLAATMRWRSGGVLLDAIYDPWPTPLAAAAARAGVAIVSGLELLLAQAVRQFVRFTGMAAPVAAMRAALPSRYAGRPAMSHREGG
ncbi:MAG TPA: shikimate dehydrogenase [Micromonosporaceae bacterium]